MAAPALGLALAATVAACSSSSTSSAASPPSSAASAPSSAAPSSPGTGSTADAAAQIKANWEKFFDAHTTVAEKVKLLQNGSRSRLPSRPSPISRWRAGSEPRSPT
jgi:hypothetical protein